MPINGDNAVATLALSFVVPCHNEDDGLDELVRRVESSVRELGISYEVVLVDDGSTDGTWRVLRQLAEEYHEVVGVRLSRSFGQQAALAAGLSMARGQRVLTLDADLQDPPELLGELMAKMDRGADVVHARRRSRTGETVLKRAEAAAFYRLLNWLCDTPIERDCGEFRLYSRRAVDELSRLPERRAFLRGLASWIGFTQAVVEYDRAARSRGESKFGFASMLRLAGDALVGFSIRPLRLASLFSFACCAAAAVGGVLGTWGVIARHAWAVWALAAALMCALSGVQLLALGVIGEYLGRLYEQSLQRPIYIVEEMVTDRGTVHIADQRFNGAWRKSYELTDRQEWESQLSESSGDQPRRDEGLGRIAPLVKRVPPVTGDALL